MSTRALSRFGLATFFIVAGSAHFLNPAPYITIMPPLIPWPRAMVAVSGAAEIAGGLGVCFSQTRRPAAWGLIALLIAVFPANLYSISTGIVLAGHRVPAWLLWARLPFQPLFIFWVYRVGLRKRKITSPLLVRRH